MFRTYTIYLGLVLLLLASCGTSKKTVKSLAGEKDPEEQAISPDQHNEFQFLFIEGLKQKMIGNIQNAVSLFSRCMEINPNSSAVMYELAKIHLAGGDHTSATLLLERAIGLSPENKWYKLMLANIFQQTRQFEKAAALYSDLSRLEPENPEFLYGKAILLLTAEKFADAIDIFNRLESQIGMNEQVSVAKQQAWIALGNQQKAREEIQRLIDWAPEEPTYYGLMADLYQSEGDSATALEFYLKILEIEPDNGFVHFSLASHFRGRNEMDKAYEHVKTGFLSQTVELENKVQMYMIIHSDQAYSGLTDEQMTELLDILLLVHAEDPRAYYLYAEYLIQNERLEEAREKVREVLAMDPSNYIHWERLLFISNDLHDWASMYADSRDAVDLFPNQPLLYALNAVASLQLQKYQEALDMLEEGSMYVLDNRMLKVQFELYKAEANYKLNRVSEAFKAYEAVIELDPENYMALNNYAYYLSLRNENLEKAERMSGKVVKANPTNPTYLDTHAWVLFKKKDYQLAKFYMETAIANGGDQNGVIVEHYGDILFMLGKVEDALNYWQKALELGDGSDLLKEKIRKKQYIEE